MAMDNIRQRFDLAYGQLASVKINHAKDNYTVHIIFPYEEKNI